MAEELAHGAFEHGFEGYGVDILRRLSALSQQHGGQFHSSYTGAFPPAPPRAFHPLALDGVGQAGRQEFASVPFLAGDIAMGDAPAGVCLGHSTLGPVSDRALPMLTLPIHTTACSLYVLHSVLRTPPGGVAGTITLHYTDGTAATQYVVEGQNVLRWNHWQYLHAPDSAHGAIVWRAQDRHHLNMQLLAYGLDNPHPDREIAQITLTAAEGDVAWIVSGVTLSDAPVVFPANPISFGIPNGWSAAAVVYALIEGLAGVKDTGVAFDHALIAPRWTAADVADVTATVKYAASGGYVRYGYHLHDGHLQLDFTSSADKVQVEVLLPKGKKAMNVKLDNVGVVFTLKQIEGSTYACVSVVGVGAHILTLQTI